MAGVAPEPRLHHLALVGGVALEPRELRVASSLEDDPDDPQDHTHEVEPAKAAAVGTGADEHQADHPRQYGLEEEHLSQTHPDEGVAFAASAHRGVAGIL